MKKAFLLKNNWIEIFDNLSDKQAGVLIKSLFKYNVNGEKPADLTDLEIKAYFNMMLLDCNTMNENYDKRCETSANNGCLGGRPLSEYPSNEAIRKRNKRKADKPNNLTDKPNKPNNLSKPDNDNDNDYDYDKDIITPLPPLNKGGSAEKTWKNDYLIYLSETTESFDLLKYDQVFIKKLEKYYPNVDIILSIEKSFESFWGTEAGWINKKGRKTKVIDWKTTVLKNFDKNRIFKQSVNERKTETAGKKYNQL